MGGEARELLHAGTQVSACFRNIRFAVSGGLRLGHPRISRFPILRMRWRRVWEKKKSILTANFHAAKR